MHVLILGTGYLGLALARHLRENNHTVTGWVRSEESATALRSEGFTVHTGDIANAFAWTLDPTPITHLVHCASSSKSGADVYAQVYREGLRQALHHLPSARTIFVSSTSVYGQTTGDWVSETSPATPSVETGKILRETEDLALSAAGIVARVGGIYGPGRGVLLRKFLAGEAIIEGDGTRWINQIHRDDIVTALAHLLDQGTSGEIYNVTDSTPATYLELYQWLTEKTGLPFPPFGLPQPGRKRGLTNKRVSNAKLRATSWSPHHPSFREGYSSLL